MVFNEKQKDGLAKALDNIWVACVIALMLGIIVEQKLTLLPMSGLFVVAVISFYGALWCRQGEQHDDQP